MKLRHSLILFLIITGTGCAFGDILSGMVQPPGQDTLAVHLDSIKTMLRFGGYSDFNLNLHSTDFQELPRVPNCCPKFNSGFGTGISIGAMLDYPMTKEYILNFRAGYNRLDALLSSTEKTKVVVGNDLLNGEFEHTIDVRLTDIGIEGLFGWRFYEGFTAMGGIKMSLLTANHYSQVETIIKPEGTGTFLDSLGNNSQKRTRGESSGELPDVSSFQLFVKAGITYDFPLNKLNTLTLSPELFFSLGVLPVVSGRSWNAHSINLGISLKYTPLPPRQLIDNYFRLEKIDTVFKQSYDIAEDSFATGRPEIYYDTSFTGLIRSITEHYLRADTIYKRLDYNLNANIYAIGIDTNGKEVREPTYVIEEFLTSRLSPLLNYVFFDDNSSVLPERYSRLTSEDADDFYVDNLYRHKTLPIYRHILNIVGRRMRLYPEAKLKITGCNSDLGSEKRNTALSRSRAETVRKYLMDVWRIAPERLEIQIRNLPEKPSTPVDEVDKIEENRRVELSCDNNDKIMEYIQLRDTIRTINPPVIRFLPEVQAEAGLKYWDIQVIQGNKIIKEFSSEGSAIESVDWKIISQLDWNVNNEESILPTINQPLEYRLRVIDKKSQEYRTQYKFIRIKVLTIQKKKLENLSDKTVDKYSLILFDFDKADIKGDNRKIVNLIKDRTVANSQVAITGYTDRTGEAQHNIDLSTNRANATRNALGVRTQKVEGLGSNTDLFDNNVPEGRFYCRTVDVLVETTTKGK
jgi:outer membrane protein OmpA-like peptidoglycan-associated protein